MTRLRRLKRAALISLAITLSAGTMSLIGHRWGAYLYASNAKANPIAKSNPSQEPLTFVRLAAGKNGAAVAPAGKASVGATFSVKRMDVYVDGADVTVAATSHLEDHIGHNVFVWHLSAQDRTNGRHVAKKLYDHQMFLVKGNQAAVENELTTTFRESIQLPPGTYNIRLALYRIPPDFDTRLLDGEEDSMPRMVLQPVRTAVVR